MGEPPSPSQPQPVYPDEAADGAAEPEDAMEAEAPAGMVEEEVMEETIVVPPTVAEDAPSEPHMGEPASPSQPQPVYPEGAPEGL
jgi:hypothetical protein